MKLRDILAGKGTQVHSIDADRTLADVVTLLMRHRIGSLIVREPASPQGGAEESDRPMVGIITERDILRACDQRERRLSEIGVREYMTPNPIHGLPDDSVDSTMGLLTQHRIRHLPIVEDDRLVGVISIGDIVKAKHDSLRLENHYLMHYIQSCGIETD